MASGIFGTIKDQVVGHFKKVWTPFDRVEGNSLLKDIFSDKNNIKKLGLRIAHIALAILLAVNALSIASAVITSVPLTTTVLLALAVAALGTGIAFTFFPNQIQKLIAKLADQIAKLRGNKPE